MHKLTSRILSLFMVFTMMLSLSPPVIAQDGVDPAQQTETETAGTQLPEEGSGQPDADAPPAESTSADGLPVSQEPEKQETGEEADPLSAAPETSEEGGKLPRLTELYEGHRIHYIDSPKHPLPAEAELFMAEIPEDEIPIYLRRAARAMGMESCGMYLYFIAEPLAEDASTAEVLHFYGDENDLDDRMTVEITLFDDEGMSDDQKASRLQELRDAHIEDLQVILLGAYWEDDVVAPHSYDEETGVIRFAVSSIDKFILIVPDWDTAVYPQEEENWTDSEEVDWAEQDSVTQDTSEQTEDAGTEVAQEDQATEEDAQNSGDEQTGEPESGLPVEDGRNEEENLQQDNTQTDQIDEPRSDGPQTDEPQTDEANTDVPQIGEPKNDESLTDEQQTDEPQTDEPQTNEPQTDEPQTDEPQTEESQTEKSQVEGPSAVSEGTVTAEGSDYSVSLTYTTDANIPEGSVFELSEVPEGGILYDHLTNSVANTLNADSEEIVSVTFVDVDVRKDGDSVSIDAPVNVSIDVADAPDSDTVTQVVALGEQNEVLDAEDENAASFSTVTDSLSSTYAIVKITKQTTLRTSDDQTWQITVTYDRNDPGIPADAELTVTELLKGTPEYEEYVAASAAATGADPNTLSFAKAFDICLIDPATGAECQPAGEVGVSIQLLEEKVEENDKIEVVHFGAEEAPKQIDCAANSEDNAIEFATPGFSVFVVAAYVVEKYYKDADGETWKISVSFDRDAGVPEDADLAVSELTEGTPEYIAYVQQAAEALGKDAEVFAFAHAFDIALVNSETGEKYQPVKPVSVSIQLLDEDVAEGDSVDVVHFPGTDAETLPKTVVADSSETEILEASVVGDAVEFKSESFSVYVVSADQRGYYFKFMSPDAEEYVQLRQTIFDGDTLVQPVAPSERGRVFKKWTWRGYEGTGEIEDFSGWGPIRVPVTQRGMENVLITAVFEDENKEKYHIVFNDQDENVYEQRTYNAGEHVDPNGTDNAANKVSYVVMQKKTGQYLTFVYWTEDLYDLDAATGKPKPFRAEDINRDISLYPYCPQAHWLYFNTNRRAAGDQSLAFVAPKVILEGEVPATAVVPTATGYTFDGWYTRANGGYQIYDAAGNAAAATSSDWDYAFEQYLYTGGDSLDYDPTLYAHWMPHTNADYTVAYWVQNPADAVALDNANKTYLLQKIVGTRTGRVGEYVSKTDEDNVSNLVIGTSLESSGLERNDTNSVDVLVKADGSTVLNVYFDRKPFTMWFWESSTGNNRYDEKTVTQLYGHDMTDHRDTFGWPYNKKNPPTLQWIDRDDTSVTSNKILTITMPAENHNYYDGASTGNTYTRRFYIESVDNTSTSHNDYSGYVLNTDKYQDARTSSAGQSSMQIYADAVDESPILGFTLVRIDAASNTDRSITKQWVIESDYHTINNYTTNRTNASSGGLMRYYGRNNQFYADLYYQRHANDLTLHTILDKKELNATTYSATKYDKPLETVAEAYRLAQTYENVKKLKDSNYWWYYDESCTVPVTNLSELTMPDREYHLYLGMRTAYEVDIDPQGGELDGVAQSTYFNLGKDETASEYNVTRDYVEWSELYESKSAIPAAAKLYKYVYNTRTNNDGTRSAKYVEMTAEERADDSITGYVYYPGLWQFQYWYEEGHPNVPFDFVTPPNRPVRLFAKWVHAGNYSIVYDASNGGRSYRVPKDTEVYLEGATAIIKASVDQPGDKQFRFWATAAQAGNSLEVPPGAKKFTPNQALTIDAQYTPGQMEQSKRTITLYAWYEDGAFTADSFADYEFYLPGENGAWTDGQAGRENIPYYKQTISPGETLILPVLPEGDAAPTGTFIGWYEEPEYKNRFTGFGEISTPINMKLYARYAEVHTVTYKEPGTDSRTITVQTYYDGELLSTLGVEFITTADKYVRYWAGSNGVNYYYLGKGAFIPEPGVGYDASDPAKNGHVKDDLVLTPVLGYVYTLSFDAQGGSYVAPIEMPHDYSRWVAEPMTTREGFTFEGWFTAPMGETNSVYPVEGGARYLFDKPLTSWAEDPDADPSTAGTVDLNANNPLRLYAHWTPSGEIKTKVTINYYIQNTERKGYFLWNSATIEDQVVGSSFYLNDKQKSTNNIQGYKTYQDDPVDDRAYFHINTSGKDANNEYGLCSEALDQEHAVEVLENGTTIVNVYFDRNLYLLTFNTTTKEYKNEAVGGYKFSSLYYGNGNTVQYDVESVPYDVVSSLTGGLSTLTVWLGKEVVSEWPMVDTSTAVTSTVGTIPRSNTRYNEGTIYGRPNTSSEFVPTSQSNRNLQYFKGYVSYDPSGGYDSESKWERNFYFTGWTENTSISLRNDSRKYSFIDKRIIPDGLKESYTFDPEYVTTRKYNPTLNSNIVNYDKVDEIGVVPSTSNAVTIHYFVTDAEGNTFEMPDYEQIMYGITGMASGSTDGSVFTPDAASRGKIESARISIPDYVYDRMEGVVRNDSQVPVYYYDYSMPTDHVYAHRFALRTFPALYLTNNINVREGQFRLNYTYLGMWGHTHGASDLVYLFPYDSNYILGRSVWEAEATWTTAQLRAYIEQNCRTLNHVDYVYKTGNHINIYYKAGNFPLTLKSAENDSWSDSRPAVMFSTFLTDETLRTGYLNIGSNKVTPPSVPGKTFSYWSTSKDSTTAFSGVMPNQPFELWAHYEDTQVAVTALGVQQNGALRRDSAKNNAIIFDQNGVPVSWNDDSSEETSDFVSLKKVYGTRLQEFELPTPALESGEVFYGWRRVNPDTGKMVGSYLSSTQGIIADTVVAPHIVVNQGGYVAYYTNGATNENLTSTNKYEEDGFLFEEGGYYFGATAKARLGTQTGTGSGTVLKKGEFAFVCWNTEKDGGGDSFYPGDPIRLPDSGVVKLYAQYSAKREITLVYHLNQPAEYSGNEAGFLPTVSGTTLVNTYEQDYDEIENEKVLKIKYSDYLTDPVKYPNSQYPVGKDANGTEFVAYCPGYTFLYFTVSRDGTGENTLKTDDVRINTLNQDENSEVHIYAQWTEIVLPIQVYEVTPGHMEDQYRLRTVENTGSATHISMNGNSSTVQTPRNSIWGDPFYNSYMSVKNLRDLINNYYWLQSAKELVIDYYYADIRHGIDPKDSYLKCVLSTDEEKEIKWIRYLDNDKTWAYSTEDTCPGLYVWNAWKEFDSKKGDELKVYYERPQYMLFFDYNGGIDEDGRSYIGESSEALLSGVETADMPVPTEGIEKTGYELVGWSWDKREEPLALDAEIPHDERFYALDDAVSLKKISQGNNGMAYYAVDATGNNIPLTQLYDDNQTRPLYAVWREAITVDVHIMELTGDGILVNRDAEWRKNLHSINLQKNASISYAELLATAKSFVRDDAAFSADGIRISLKEHAYFDICGKSGGSVVDILHRLNVNGAGDILIDNLKVLDKEDTENRIGAVYLYAYKGVRLEAYKSDNGTTWTFMEGSRLEYWNIQAKNGNLQPQTLVKNEGGWVGPVVTYAESKNCYDRTNYKYAYAVLGSDEKTVVDSIQAVTSDRPGQLFKWQYKVKGGEGYTDLGDDYIVLRYFRNPLRVPIYWVYDNKTTGKFEPIPDEDKTWYSLVMDAPAYADVGDNQSFSLVKSGSGIYPQGISKWVYPNLGVAQTNDTATYPFIMYRDDGTPDGNWRAKYQFSYFAIGPQDIDESDKLHRKYDDSLAMYLKMTEDGVAFANNEQMVNALTSYSLGLYVVYSGEPEITGARRVILRKVNSSFETFDGARFEISKTPGGPPAADAAGTTLSNMQSYASGVFYAGEMNYGTYYVKETAPPSGYSVPGEGKYFIITVDDAGVGYHYLDDNDVEKVTNEVTAQSAS